MEKKSMAALGRVDIQTFKTGIKTPLVIILDNVRSAYNVGSVFRTSDAFKVEKIYCCGFTAGGDNKEVLKTALGATNSVDWQQVADTAALIDLLKTKGYTIWAIEQVHGSIPLQQISHIPNPLALVLGNEVHGVDEKALSLCESVIEIPQFGTKHSLNVSVTAGIVLWHLSLVGAQTSSSPS